MGDVSKFTAKYLFWICWFKGGHKRMPGYHGGSDYCEFCHKELE
jgi:hypothetical protein